MLIFFFKISFSCFSASSSYLLISLLSILSHLFIHPSIDSSYRPLRPKQNMQLRALQLHLWLKATQELGSYANLLVCACWSLCLLVVSCPFVHKEMDFDFIATPISIVFGHKLQNLPGDNLSYWRAWSSRKKRRCFLPASSDGWVIDKHHCNYWTGALAP